MNLKTTEALGFPWLICSDTIFVEVEISPKEVTRRKILSMNSQIFDPLGFLQPLLLLKKLLQELAVNSMKWDGSYTGKTKLLLGKMVLVFVWLDATAFAQSIFFS